MRTLSYAEAISEGTVQAMDRDPSVFIAGIAVDYPSGIFGTTTEPFKRFGKARVFDTPAMENALTVARWVVSPWIPRHRRSRFTHHL